MSNDLYRANYYERINATDDWFLIITRRNGDVYRVTISNEDVERVQTKSWRLLLSKGYYTVTTGCHATVTLAKFLLDPPATRSTTAAATSRSSHPARPRRCWPDDHRLLAGPGLALAAAATPRSIKSSGLTSCT
jgi:hypothetical protein